MTPKYTNRLIDEKSPYLLQHAHNPVDWYPWGDEAFEKAREEDKPIFLSIGYATCHWCHVMERESFENPEVADKLNQTFVNIKVDREERPEVDGLYMEFAQSMMSGSAGWPLNIILTPDLEPFFATTYLPPFTKGGLMGVSELVEKIREVWNSEERMGVVSQAEKIVEIFSQNLHTQGDELPVKEDLVKSAEIFYKLADPIWGGLKGSPKFPIGYQIVFLIRYFHTSKDSRALFLAERTLDMMQRGGIWDHVGGGFSRYAVDEEWFQPHFEKMLYDNALLLQAYLEGYLATRKPLYRKVLEGIIDYVLTDMTGPEGAFYSAEDADSEGKEGLFYTWKKSEIVEALGKTQGELFCELYGVEEEGNFEGQNILSLTDRPPEFAEARGLELSLVEEVDEEGLKTLRKIRERRVRPLKDDKVLSSWNGLMIYGLVEAASALGEVRWLNVAKRAALFMKEAMWREGILYRRYRDGEVRFKAGLDEYAFVIRAAISLFEAGEGSEWLEWALEMTRTLEEQFKTEEGAFLQTDGQDPSIVLRRCSFADGAEPSGNAIHCENLLRLWQITFDTKFLKQAEDILKAVKSFADNYPPGYTFHRMNLDRYLNQKLPSMVVALGSEGVDKHFIVNCLARDYIPLKSVVFKDKNDTVLERAAPQLKEYLPREDRTTVYLCQRGVCQEPLTEAADIQDAILKLAQTV